MTRNPGPAAALRNQDYVRGLLIAVISLVAGYAILAPPPEGTAAARFTPGAITMIVVGVLLQVGVIVGNLLVTRYERAHGMEGQLAPGARHVLQLLADGASVLLFALAVFGGIVGAASSI